jgi:hypothetical protein
MSGDRRATRAFARFAVLGAALGLSFALTACESSKSKETVERAPDVSSREFDREDSGFGKGVDLFSGSKGGESPQVAVNAYLWRASLDTVAFMPVASADPFGGVIITDWYSLPETPDERFKVNVFILGRALRSDGIKVSVFRQIRDQSGHWNDAVVGAQVAPEFEDAVLARARQLRLQATDKRG